MVVDDELALGSGFVPAWFVRRELSVPQDTYSSVFVVVVLHSEISLWVRDVSMRLYVAPFEPSGRTPVAPVVTSALRSGDPFGL